MSYKPTLDERLRAEAQQMAKDFGEDCFGQDAFYHALRFAAALALREAAESTDRNGWFCDDCRAIHTAALSRWLRARADEIEKGGP